ncbi:MAG: hypothetical protein ACKV2Q_09550 [Planctomycetaceae bacterium]
MADNTPTAAVELPPKRKTKPTTLEAQDRRLKVVRMRRRGMSVESIAKSLKVRLTVVMTDLELLRGEWSAKASAEYDAMMAEQLGELLMLRVDAMQAFEDTKHTKTKPAGDPRFLEIARAITNDIADFLSLKDRAGYEMRRTMPISEESARILEVTVGDRAEVDQLRDEHGNISLTNYLARLKQAVEDVGTAKATPAAAEA